MNACRKRWHRPRYTEQEKQAIVTGLVKLRQRGILQGVWYADDAVHIRWPGQLEGEPEALPWWEAGDMTGHRSIEYPSETPRRFIPTLVKRRGQKVQNDRRS